MTVKATKRPRRGPDDLQRDLKAQKVVKLDMNNLLVAVVGEMTKVFADTMAAGGENPLKIEASLYQLLAVNCEAKAKLAKSLAGTI